MADLIDMFCNIPIFLSDWLMSYKIDSLFTILLYFISITLIVYFLTKGKKRIYKYIPTMIYLILFIAYIGSEKRGLQFLMLPVGFIISLITAASIDFIGLLKPAKSTQK